MCLVGRSCELDRQEAVTDNGNMESSAIETLRRSVASALEIVSVSTEEVYLRLAEVYPGMISELDSGFGAPLQGDAARRNLTEVIAGSLEAIQDYEGRSGLLRAGVRESLELLAEKMELLGKLRDSIELIREDSVLMELISLNALVVASKAGEAGRGFSFITSELKNLSSQTIQLTDQIKNKESTLRTAFFEFRENLDKANRRSDSGLDAFLLNSRSIFDGLKSESDRLLGELQGIRKKSEEVKAPLVKIMVAIQNQDRIRQSLDHVKLSLTEFVKHESSEATEDVLDELSFLETLPELSVLVLDEIQTQILGDRKLFQKSIEEARRLVQGLEAERLDFLELHFNGRQKGTLEIGFESCEKLFFDFLKDAESHIRGQEQSRRRISSLQGYVTDLVDSLSSFEELVSRFRNIDIASRIQVARHKELSAMNNNATEMSALTERISGDYVAAISLAREFFSAVEGVFSAFSRQDQTRLGSDQEFNERLNQVVAALKAGHAALVQSIRDSEVFTVGFTKQFSQSEHDLVVLDGLKNAISEQKKSLQEVKTRISAEKKGVMKELGIAEWKLENEKLKAIVSRFTIFAHKKMAAGLGEFEVEDSVESGDVTLF
jgi:hypothetical protein